MVLVLLGLCLSLSMQRTAMLVPCKIGFWVIYNGSNLLAQSGQLEWTRKCLTLPSSRIKIFIWVGRWSRDTKLYSLSKMFSFYCLLSICTVQWLHDPTFRRNVLTSSSEWPDCFKWMLKATCQLYETFTESGQSQRQTGLFPAHGSWDFR